MIRAASRIGCFARHSTAARAPIGTCQGHYPAPASGMQVFRGNANQANPMEVLNQVKEQLEKIGNDPLKKAQEVSEHISAAMGSSATTPKLPDLPDLSSVVELSQSLLPALSAIMLVTRSPGSAMTAEQEEKFRKVVPGNVI